MLGFGLSWTGAKSNDDLQSLRDEVRRLKAQLEIIHLILETYTKNSSPSK